MPHSSPDIPALLRHFVDISKDGYGIFSSEDILVYANYAFMDIFCLPDDCLLYTILPDDFMPSDHLPKNETTHRLSFENIVRRAFALKRGIKIDSDDIETWLEYVRGVRRKRKFRIFEVDLLDGRWILFSEQELPNGELLVQGKDLTRQKALESQLKSSVQTLNKLALTDELTQLANRRSFVQTVEHQIMLSQDLEKTVTLLALDIDLFKVINDTHGHNTGDKVLQHCATLIKNAVRQHDIVGRLGGEEFAIYLGTTDGETAYRIAERIREKLASSPLSVANNNIQVTASIGMTTLGADASFKRLYTQADEALYQAKTKGRNRVEIFTQSSNSHDSDERRSYNIFDI